MQGHRGNQRHNRAAHVARWLLAVVTALLTTLLVPRVAFAESCFRGLTVVSDIAKSNTGPSAALQAPANTVKAIAHELQEGGKALGNMATEIDRGNHEKAGSHLATATINTMSVAMKVDGMIKTASSLQKPPAGPSVAKQSAQGQGAGQAQGCSGGNCGVGGACFAGGTLVDTPSGAVAIEDVRVGMRVLTSTGFNETKVDSSWRKATLRLPNPWGHPEETLDIELLRPAQMLDDAGYSDNALVWFGLGELGIEGVARVVSVTDAPYIETGPGRVVTLTVTHRTTELMRLGFVGQSETLEPTIRHRLYSESRHDWVKASELLVGEDVRTEHGVATVALSQRLAGLHRVYNLEVEDDHEYYVGSLKALSHNTGPGDCAGRGAVEGAATAPKGPSFDKAREAAFKKAGMTDPSAIEFSKMDPETGTVVEFKGAGGAKVGYDGPHPNSPGPHHDQQHISLQSAGKRGAGGAIRENIPYSGPQHPSRSSE
jgi:hypothetical protein